MITYSDGITSDRLLINDSVRAAMIIAITGTVNLDEYRHPLPDSLTSIDANVDTGRYKFPLPAGLIKVGGRLNLYGYEHPLPKDLTVICGDLYLDNYYDPLPAKLTQIAGVIFTNPFEKYILPSNMQYIGDDWSGYSIYADTKMPHHICPV